MAGERHGNGMLCVNRPLMYSVYCTNEIKSINYTRILKTCLQHVSAQVYHLQGAQNAGSETTANDKLLFTIRSSIVVDIDFVQKLHIVHVLKILKHLVQS